MGKHQIFNDLRREWDVEVGDVCKDARGVYVVVNIYDQFNDDKDDYDYFADVVYKNGMVEADVPLHEVATDDFIAHFDSWKKAIASDYFKE